MNEQELHNISLAAHERAIQMFHNPPAPDSDTMRLMEMNRHILDLVGQLYTERKAIAALLQNLQDTFANEWVHFNSALPPADAASKGLYEWYEQFQHDMMEWMGRERKRYPVPTDGGAA